ncbi:77495a56-3171-4ecb-971b-84b8cea0d687 [Thermothielavioides terrestris]|jgi:hypothetical protein
MSRI